jgi:hypothetical protein
MANRYVYSGAGGAGTGADWANAHTNLAAAITASSAGDVFFVASDHSYNYGTGQNLTFKGTAAAPDRILSVNRAGSVPPVAADLLAGATEGINAASSALSINGGTFYCYGMTFAPGSGQTTTCSFSAGAGTGLRVFDGCEFHLLSTGVSSRLTISGSPTAIVEFNKPKFKFGSTSQSVTVDGPSFITGDPAASILATGSSVPTSLFTAASAPGDVVRVAGVDLSAITGVAPALTSNAGLIRLANCKLHASATFGTPTAAAARVEVVGCNNGGPSADYRIYDYKGTLTTETTIKRTAGASDGTTAYCWKIVTTANAERDFPLETFEGVLWNDTTGASKTLTVHTVTDNVTLTDAEIWLEVEYLGSSGSPISTLITDANATVLTTAANQASDSGEAWTTTGLTTPVKQKLEVTFTPQMAGPIRWRVKVAKVSTTVYVCPKPDLS